MFSKGLSSLSSLAGSAAATAREKAAQAHLDQTAAVAAEKAKEVGSKGWSLLKSAYAQAASTVESVAAQNGYKVDLGSRKVAATVAPGGGGYSQLTGHQAPAGHFDHDSSGGYGAQDQWGRSGSSGNLRGGQPAAAANDDWDSWGGGGGGGSSNGRMASGGSHSQQQRPASGAAGGEWSGWDDGDAAPQAARGTAPKKADEDDWGKW